MRCQPRPLRNRRLGPRGLVAPTRSTAHCNVEQHVASYSCVSAMAPSSSPTRPRSHARTRHRADDGSSVHWPAGTRMLQHAGLCCNVLYRTGRRRQVHRRKVWPMWPAARAAGSALLFAARTECCRATCCASSRPLRVRGSARQRRTRGSPLPHLRQDWTHARHICTRTGGLMCSLQLAR
jgi:hypothetical protein